MFHRWTCRHCGEKFLRFGSYLNHKKEHDDLSRAHAWWDSEQERSRRVLSRERSTEPSAIAAQDADYVCPGCGVGYQDAVALKQHLESRAVAEAKGGTDRNQYETMRCYESSAFRHETNLEQRPYLAEADYTRRYALEHRDELLSRREEILEEDSRLMGDPERLSYLRLSRPKLGGRILDAARFEMRALRIAESDTPRKETETEWRARQVRLLERRLEDAKARKSQELTLRAQIVAFLNKHQVTDEVEREKHIQEITQAVFPKAPSNVEHEEQGPAQGSAEDEVVEILGR